MDQSDPGRSEQGVSEPLSRSVYSMFFSSVADNHREASWGDLRGKERLGGCWPAGSVLTLEWLFWVLEKAVPGYLLSAPALLVPFF